MILVSSIPRIRRISLQCKKVCGVDILSWQRRCSSNTNNTGYQPNKMNFHIRTNLTLKLYKEQNLVRGESNRVLIYIKNQHRLRLYTPRMAATQPQPCRKPCAMISAQQLCWELIASYSPLRNASDKYRLQFRLVGSAGCMLRRFCICRLSGRVNRLIVTD